MYIHAVQYRMQRISDTKQISKTRALPVKSVLTRWTISFTLSFMYFRHIFSSGVRNIMAKSMLLKYSVQFSHSVVSDCDPVDCSMPGLYVHHQLLELIQSHVHRVGDAIQPSHPLLSPSPPHLNLSQYQGLFQWVSYSHQVAKVLEFQLQHQSFQWTPRTDLL